MADAEAAARVAQARDGDLAAPDGSVRRVSTVAELAALFEPTVSTVVLERVVTAAVARDVARLGADPAASVCSAVPLGRGLGAVVRQLLRGADALADDIAFWAELCGELDGSEEVGVRLARVTKAMCPRLHVDRVTVRAVCAYVGAGTEFVESSGIERAWLGPAGAGRADSCNGVLRPGGVVESARTGDLVSRSVASGCHRRSAGCG